MNHSQDKIIRFPFQREFPGIDLYILDREVIFHRGRIVDRYSLHQKLDEEDRRVTYVHEEWSIDKLARQFVEQLPNPDTPFAIGISDNLGGDWYGLYGNVGYLRLTVIPSQRVLEKFQVILDRELRSRKEGIRGVITHYQLRAQRFLRNLKERLYY